MKPFATFASRLVLAGVILVVLILAGLTGMGYFLAGPTEFTPQLIENPQSNRAAHDTGGSSLLRVLTLNLYHGRGVSGIVVSAEQARANLEAAAELVRHVAPHVVALQEADEASPISGGFNHIKQLALSANLKYAVVGRHLAMGGWSYGTGFMSALPLENVRSHTFKPIFPTLTKGFVLATVPWPGNPSVKVDLVSVHLDFLRTFSRRRQADVLVKFLAGRKNRLVVMGDLNSDWQSENSVVRYLVKQLNLKAYQPDADNTPTFPATGDRIDWILISTDLSFVDYTVRPENVSDHLAVSASLRLVSSK